MSPEANSESPQEADDPPECALSAFTELLPTPPSQAKRYYQQHVDSHRRDPLNRPAETLLQIASGISEDREAIATVSIWNAESQSPTTVSPTERLFVLNRYSTKTSAIITEALCAQLPRFYAPIAFSADLQLIALGITVYRLLPNGFRKLSHEGLSPAGGSSIDRAIFSTSGACDSGSNSSSGGGLGLLRLRSEFSACGRYLAVLQYYPDVTITVYEIQESAIRMVLDYDPYRPNNSQLHTTDNPHIAREIRHRARRKTCPSYDPYPYQRSTSEPSRRSSRAAMPAHTAFHTTKDRCTLVWSTIYGTHVFYIFPDGSSKRHSLLDRQLDSLRISISGRILYGETVTGSHSQVWILPPPRDTSSRQTYAIQGCDPHSDYISVISNTVDLACFNLSNWERPEYFLLLPRYIIMDEALEQLKARDAKERAFQQNPVPSTKENRKGEEHIRTPSNEGWDKKRLNLSDIFPLAICSSSTLIPTSSGPVARSTSSETGGPQTLNFHSDSGFGSPGNSAASSERGVASKMEYTSGVAGPIRLRFTRVAVPDGAPEERYRGQEMVHLEVVDFLPTPSVTGTTAGIGGCGAAFKPRFRRRKVQVDLDVFRRQILEDEGLLQFLQEERGQEMDTGGEGKTGNSENASTRWAVNVSLCIGTCGASSYEDLVVGRSRTDQADNGDSYQPDGSDGPALNQSQSSTQFSRSAQERGSRSSSQSFSPAPSSTPSSSSSSSSTTAPSHSTLYSSPTTSLSSHRHHTSSSHRYSHPVSRGRSSPSIASLSVSPTGGNGGAAGSPGKASLLGGIGFAAGISVDGGQRERDDREEQQDGSGDRR